MRIIDFSNFGRSRKLKNIYLKALFILQRNFELAISKEFTINISHSKSETIHFPLSLFFQILVRGMIIVDERIKMKL